MKNSFAILILSCDKYSDIWPEFFKFFWKNFPIGNWPVYLGSNSEECGEPGVVSLLSGYDTDWSSSYKKILAQIPQKKIFVILEDLFLSSSVDEEVLRSLIEFMIEKDANHIKYWANSAAPDFPTDNPLIGGCDKGAPYRATVCGIWDREYLLRLLLAGENPWNFEVLGSYRTSYSDGFYTTIQPICEYKNMIEKGQWMPASVDWASRNGAILNLGVRPELQGKSHLISRFQRGVFQIVLNIQWRYRVKLMNWLRKLFISY